MRLDILLVVWGPIGAEGTVTTLPVRSVARRTRADTTSAHTLLGIDAHDLSAHWVAVAHLAEQVTSVRTPRREQQALLSSQVRYFAGSGLLPLAEICRWRLVASEEELERSRPLSREVDREDRSPEEKRKKDHGEGHAVRSSR